MKILFVGDVYGSVGMESLHTHLLKVKLEHKIDFTIVNGENISKGKSLSKKDYDKLKPLNIDCFTMGNHAWFGNKLCYLDEVDNIVTPINYSEYQKEPGSLVFERKGLKIRVTNALGQVFMNYGFSSPFKKIDELLEVDDSDIHIVDFHAEATSEKMIMAWDLDGKVNAVCGTHTHVQTADERILPKGTAFITDIGFTGCWNSAIGVDIEAVHQKVKYSEPSKFFEAEGKPQFCAVVITIDDHTKKTKSIERIFIQP